MCLLTRIRRRVALSAFVGKTSTEREGWMSSSSKRQQTMAKRTRELRVKERRALKLEKKHAAALARSEQAAAEGPIPQQPAEEETHGG
jgi:hypothetical protein